MIRSLGNSRQLLGLKVAWLTKRRPDAVLLCRVSLKVQATRVKIEYADLYIFRRFNKPSRNETEMIWVAGYSEALLKQYNVKFSIFLYKETGAPNENIVEKHLNTFLNVF